MEKVTQIFVYGSLRSGFKSAAYDYITKYFSLVGNATVKGILYDMGNYPVAVETTEEKFIVGELYKINQEIAFDFVIAQLDDYEGLDAESDEQVLYKRVLTDVYINETKTPAYVYWFCGSVHNKPAIASGDVLKYFEEKNKA